MAKGFVPFVAAGVLVALAFVPGAVFADWFVGFDGNGDNDCEAADFDRGRFYPAAEIGTADSFTIFFQGPDPILTVGCVFCVTVDSLIGPSVTFTYTLASGWTPVPIAEEEGASFVVSESFSAAYPSHRCWMVQGGDFAGTNPVSTYPYVIGTFTYQVAKEGGIHFAFDTGEGGQGVAVLTTGFSSIVFTAAQACNYAMTATESHSWGSIKQLFR
jgi:hypothetical protein